MEQKDFIESTSSGPNERSPETEPTVNISSSIQQMTNNMRTMQDRMQILQRALNEGDVGGSENNCSKAMGIAAIRRLKWAPVDGDICVICQDTMHLKAKALPCKHLFHPQ